MMNSKIFPLTDEPEYDTIFEKVVYNKFYVTTKIEEIAAKSDIIILSLWTSMDENTIFQKIIYF